MVIDSSALIAILRDEPERADFNRRIEADPARLMSAVSFVETAAVIETRYGLPGRHMVDEFVRHASIEIVGVDLDQAMLARDAYRRFGKGRHPARLNLGDCFAYALAKATSEPLLFKGEDFSRTDLARA